MKKVIIIGGGAAGMMAAWAAASAGSAVCLLEKNEKPGKKIYITGKGRCNFTNASPMDVCMKNVMRNPRFLYSAFAAFSSSDMMAFVEGNGVPVKVERGNRAFPVSDHASDITKALTHALKAWGVEVRLNTEVAEILTAPLKEDAGGKEIAPVQAEGAGKVTQSVQAESVENMGRPAQMKQKRTAKKKGQLLLVTGVRLADGSELAADAVIVATGGLSYKTTGSTGDGIRFAEALDLKTVKTFPSLVPLNAAEDYIPAMQGLSLKNVTLTIRSRGKKKPLYSDFGEMLFTHFGVSGPLVLSASASIGDALEEGPLDAVIDLKPALTEEDLKERIVRETGEGPKKEYSSLLKGLLPSKMIPVFLDLSEIEKDRPLSAITREDRARIIALLKAFPFTVTGLRDYNEAIITRGGVACSEISPKTMEAKKVKGLYFAGEVLDVDALTGGFNLQIAWSTGFLAGRNAGEVIEAT